jgi:Spy/CpxP family protein refolding chaperone
LKFPTKPKNQNPKARLTLQNFTSRDKKHSTKPIFRASNIVKSESLIPKIKKRYKMSFKNKFFSALTMAFALLAFSTFASAQETPKTDSDNTQKREWRKGKRDGSGKGFRRGGMRGGKYLRGFRDLNLTDAQKAQVRTIMEANRPDQAAFEEMKTTPSSQTRRLTDRRTKGQTQNSASAIARKRPSRSAAAFGGSHRRTTPTARSQESGNETETGRAQTAAPRKPSESASGK